MKKLLHRYATHQNDNDFSAYLLEETKKIAIVHDGKKLRTWIQA